MTVQSKSRRLGRRGGERRPIRAGSPPRRGARRRAYLQLLSLALFLAGWEAFSWAIGAIDIPGAKDTLSRFASILFEGELWQALWVSNQALLLGFFAACAVGIPGGLLIGRSRTADAVSRLWLSVLMVTPMAMLVPLFIMALGFGLSARSLVIVIFVLPMILVNCKAGVRTIPPDLLEMGRSFGASERQLWAKILVPGAAPAIFAGLRIGLGRAVTGMVISEWLLASVGIGMLLLRYRGAFQSDALYSVVLIILIESLVLIQVLRAIERRFFAWAG